MAHRDADVCGGSPLVFDQARVMTGLVYKQKRGISKAYVLLCKKAVSAFL